MVAEDGAGVETGVSRRREPEAVIATRAGTTVLIAAAAVLVAVSAPVLIQGSPLADDAVRCQRVADLGVLGQLSAVLEGRGLVRPFRYLEVTWIGWLCGRVPFGLVMLPGLVATLTTAWLARGLLRDLGVPDVWAALAGAMWLLHPAGLESALWASAMHVPIGLALALAALRLLRRERLLLGVLAAAAAMTCTEHVLFALPIAAALLTPARSRARAAVAVAGVTLLLVLVYTSVPGADERATLSIAERLRAPVQDLGWYARFPAVGLGVPAVLGALRWAPVAAGVLAASGAALGWRMAPSLPSGTTRRVPWTAAVWTAAVLLAVNAPSIVTVPRDDSPRLFTATWLVLSLTVAWAASRATWRRSRVLGAASGVAAGVAVLSLAFASGVRVTHAERSAAIFDAIADAVPEGGVAVLCDVPAKLVDPAPAGAFSLHDLFYDWAAEPSLWVQTGRRASLELVYEGESCPPADSADLRTSIRALPGGAP